MAYEIVQCEVRWQATVGYSGTELPPSTYELLGDLRLKVMLPKHWLWKVLPVETTVGKARVDMATVGSLVCLRRLQNEHQKSLCDE